MITSQERQYAPLDLDVQNVANFAVHVCAELDFPVKAFIASHREDIHAKENSPAALQEAVTSSSER